MAQDAVVVTNQLTKKYGDFTALDQLSLTLERGHILGFIGPNGAGKTTTIKILVGAGPAHQRDGFDRRRRLCP
jgi:ABC-type multidrug transport system ATPase subunit